MMSIVTFYFKDRSSIEYPWLVVNKIHSSILPPQENNLLEVQGREAQYHVGKKVGVRPERIDITILADSQEELAERKRILAQWLNSDTPQPFRYSFEPDKEYKAILDGESEMEKTVTDGNLTLTFIIPDPYAYGNEITQRMYEATNPLVLHTSYDMDLDANNTGVADAFTPTTAAGNTVVYAIEDQAQKMQVTASTSSSSPYLGSGFTPAAPGDQWGADMMIKVPQVVGGYTMELGVVYLNAANTYLSVQSLVVVSTTTTDYVYVSTNFATAPANTAKIQVRLRSKSAASGDMGTVYIRELKLYKVNATTPEDGVDININNTVSVHPKLHYQFTANTTEFAIMQDDQYLYFGQPAEQGGQSDGSSVGGTPQRTQILHDNGSSTSGYTSGIAVDGGTIPGTFTSNGSAIICNAYGDDATNPKWHGAAGVKTLGGATEIQDFTLQAELAFKAGYPYQVGRIEIYLLSISNAVIGKMGIRDSSNKVDNPYLEARVGNSSTGKYFVNYTGKVGRWKNFGGPLRISRKGKVWEFSASKRNSKGILYDTFTYRYVDKDNTYQTKLAGIQIHIAKYGTIQPISTVYFDDIQIWNENTLNPVIEIPYVFEIGDVLDIDNSSGEILKNAESFYSTLDPTSQFLKLEQGTNNLKIFPRDVTNAYLTYRERWL